MLRFIPRIPSMIEKNVLENNMIEKNVPGISKFSRKLIALSLAGTMAISLAACGGGAPAAPTPAAPATGNQAEAPPAAQGEPVNIIFGDEGALTQPQVKAALWAMEGITEETGGRITFQHFPDSVLGSGMELVQQTMDGTIQMTAASVGLFSAFTPVMQALQLPFLLDSYDKMRVALDTQEFEDLLSSLEEVGIRGLAIGECGMRHFAHVNHPIYNLEDIQGERIRIVPSAMLQDAMTLIGANPVTLPFGEVYTALQNNLVDALEINLMSMYTMRFYEVINYFSFIGLYPFPVVYSMNLDFFNSLTAEDQEIITRWFRKAQDLNFDTWLLDIETQALQAMLDSGIVTNYVADSEPFRQLMMPVWEELSAQDPRIAAFVQMASAIE